MCLASRNFWSGIFLLFKHGMRIIVSDLRLVNRSCTRDIKEHLHLDSSLRYLAIKLIIIVVYDRTRNTIEVQHKYDIYSETTNCYDPLSLWQSPIIVKFRLKLCNFTIIGLRHGYFPWNLHQNNWEQLLLKSF